MLTNRSGKWLTLSELEAQLARIQEDSANNPPEYGVGEFTTMDRDTWATVRAEMATDQINRQSFKQIETCLFVR